MNSESHHNENIDEIATAAADWALRQDRGLSATEQDEFSQWLAADPRNRQAWAEHRWGWDELDRLAGLQSSVHAVPDPDLLLPRNQSSAKKRNLGRYVYAGLAAAAVAVGVFFARELTRSSETPDPNTRARLLARIEQRELPDGSVINLNRGAVVIEHFTSGERRVRLLRGEALFKVAKDPSRPFYVEASGVAVRAVGTAFNVRLDAASVEVLVTEGKVGVERTAPGSASRQAERLVSLEMGERTVVSLSPKAPPPEVTVMPRAQIEARLAWQPRLLDFTNTPLAEIVAEFNRHNPVHLVLRDPGLDQVRLSATFRSDNVQGFVRLMESDFGMKAEWRHDGEILLSRVR